MIQLCSKDKHKLIGKKISSYTIKAVIGQGRYGVCFLAHSDAGKKVVIKKFKRSMFILNGKKNEFEAVILSQLKDPRVPELLGVINEQGFYAFVLEFKPGRTIKEMLFTDHYRFTDKEIYDIGLKLIGIIKYLHHRGIVHRDIRIPNVLLQDGEVFLVDFGLARWANHDRYSYSYDYSYLGDFLLYLFYSSFDESQPHNKKAPWYQELNLSDDKSHVLKKMLRLKLPYGSIDEIEADFIRFFKA